MPSGGFRKSLGTIWFRLTTLGVLALVFTEALILAPGKAQGWSFYLTVPEVWFEIVVRLIAAALAGTVLGTVCAALMAPLLRFFPHWRDRIIDTSSKFAVVLIVFLLSRFA